jgi:hypothetical protein
VRARYNRDANNTRDRYGPDSALDGRLVVVGVVVWRSQISVGVVVFLTWNARVSWKMLTSTVLESEKITVAKEALSVLLMRQNPLKTRPGEGAKHTGRTYRHPLSRPADMTNFCRSVNNEQAAADFHRSTGTVLQQKTPNEIFELTAISISLPDMPKRGASKI